MAEAAAYARKGYKGGAKPSTIPAGISNSATTFAGADLSTWAGCTLNGPVTIVFDRGLATEEVGEFTTISGNNVSSLTRGLRGTSAVQHSANCAIELVSSDRDFDEANRLVNAILGISGLAAGDLLELLTATTFGRVAKGTLGQLLAMNDGATGHIRVSTPPLSSRKHAVRAATTANGTDATAFANGSVIDGVTLATGDRFLRKNQTTGSENGIFIVAASGAPTRATDFDAAAKSVASSDIEVSEGTVNAKTKWVLSNTGTVTPGSTALVFKQKSSLVGVAQGDVVYFDGTNWVILPKGIDGKVLTLASGVPSWATASSVVGSLLDEKFAVVASDQAVTSSATPVNITALPIAMGANQTWVFDVVLFVSGNSTGDLRITFTVPAGSSAIWAPVNGAVLTTDPISGTGTLYVPTNGAGVNDGYGLGAGAGGVLIEFKAVIRTSATTGNFQPQFAQWVSNATATTVKTDSHVIGKRYV